MVEEACSVHNLSVPNPQSEHVARMVLPARLMLLGMGVPSQYHLASPKLLEEVEHNVTVPWLAAVIVEAI